MKRANTKSRRPRRQTGFTLVELMAAMVILCVGLFGIIQLQLVAIRGSGYAQERAEALLIAQGVQEELQTRALGWVLTRGGTPLTFTMFFNAYYPGIVLSPTPPVGTNLSTADLHAMPSYILQAISTGAAPGNALPINVDGIALGAGGLKGTRTIYRVHYVAYLRSAELNVAPKGDIVEMRLVVSWDNKSYGSQTYDWINTWWANFFSRHFVITPPFEIVLQQFF